MNPFSKLRSLRPRKRWQSFLLEAGLILAVILGAQYWQTRGLAEGADGYITKSSDPRELAPAIESIHRGESFVTPQGHLVTAQSIHFFAADSDLHGVLARQRERDRQVGHRDAVAALRDEHTHL